MRVSFSFLIPIPILILVFLGTSFVLHSGLAIGASKNPESRKWRGLTPEFIRANTLSDEDKYHAPAQSEEDLEVNSEASVSLEQNPDLTEVKLPKVELIVDSSGSMGQLMDSSKTKMYITKKVLSHYLIDQWKEKAMVGTRVYGSKLRNDCKDNYLAIPFQERNMGEIERKMGVIMPIGRTPLNDSMEAAIDDLKKYDGPKRIVIFTDGKETCGGDPCKLAKKVEQNPKLDIKIFVVGIGFDPRSKDYEKVKCLGNFSTTANNEEELFDAVSKISNHIKTGNNLQVISPEPAAMVNLYRWDDGKRVFFRSFTARWSIRVPPGIYDAEVALNPYYRFPKFTIEANNKVTLRVDGSGTVNVQFVKGLMDVELLDVNAKVIHRFKSDKAYLAKTGKYKLRLFKKPYFEEIIPSFLVVPKGLHDYEVASAGVVQLNYPKTVGYYIYDAKDSLVGPYISNFPLILKNGFYKLYLDKACFLKSIGIAGSESGIRDLSCADAKPGASMIQNK
jgi:hypothetical protein